MTIQSSKLLFRVIDTAATCVQNSLGFTFLHQSKEQLPGEDNKVPETKTEVKEAEEDEVRRIIT